MSKNTETVHNITELPEPPKKRFNWKKIGTYVAAAVAGAGVVLVATSGRDEDCKCETETENEVPTDN